MAMSISLNEIITGIVELNLKRNCIPCVCDNIYVSNEDKFTRIIFRLTYEGCLNYKGSDIHEICTKCYSCIPMKRAMLYSNIILDVIDEEMKYIK